MDRERLFEGLPQVGGHCALDLMNTVEHRGRQDPGDHLRSLEQLLGWCQLSGLIDGEEGEYVRDLAGRSPAASERMLEEVRQLREQGRNAMRAKLNGLVDHRAANLLRKRIERAARRVHVVVDSCGTHFKREHPLKDLESLVDRIALSIEDAFEVAAREPLRECEGTDCDWLFFDRTRSGRRRWCHPGQCGNAERVRNFRARRAPKSLGKAAGNER